MAVIKDDSRCPVKKAVGDRLRHLSKTDPAKLKEVLSEFSPEQIEAITYDQEYWARDKQWIDLSKAPAVTLLLCGRGLT